MRTFQWSANFVTGLSTVDDQHRYLVELINLLGDLLGSNRVHRDDLETLYGQLVDYAGLHFKEEEGLMERLGLDARHVDVHVQMHRDFLEEVTRLHGSMVQDAPLAGKHLLDYLIHWLTFHILGQDQHMARQIEAIRAGVTPEAAYTDAKRTSLEQVEPLVNALSALFTQVSERNWQLVQLNQSLEARVEARTRELTEANRQLEVLSLTDVLTGLPNRRHAMQHLEALWEESSRLGKPLACMMIDADHFKEVNDTYGHESGDRVLIELARTLRHTMRNDDIVCRLGGDEFLVLCPDTPLQGAFYIAEQIKDAVAAMRVPTGAGAWKGSSSIGVAVRTPAMSQSDELIKLADDSVYLAKRAGKNCVRSANDKPRFKSSNNG
ncbi:MULTISPECIES: GGDEF domain-containing protein [Ectothiorhodospira]|uniref:GGDEF domain-containing protein n=1 Tax=Ectothiorhodospira TaxID=1051 RepID=UPI001EE7E809|nr:diguanylate cyclase [Ectothiorhodospira variabilis]MCG5499149.1 diguanylate cyclase [Ectothiorhodospira variabilis]MCG5505314.1 diguanylate cyclase [Ectothiorhodospira variabilis]MCG5508477.1 diguanylate cyclase [Ectothiorhodospira variabilis]MCG5525685.1 diguanylate cyclase [Ectothiorhodospira haloalkaliphila]